MPSPEGKVAERSEVGRGMRAEIENTASRTEPILIHYLSPFLSRPFGAPSPLGRAFLLQSAGLSFALPPTLREVATPGAETEGVS